MRISDNMVASLLRGNLAMSRENLYRIQAKITSGKNVQLPSDDPTAYELIYRLKNDQACLTQKARNADGLSLDLSGTDSVLQNVQDILHRVNELAISASDGTKPPEDRVSMGKELDLLLNQMVGLANSSIQGRHLFGGLRTQDTPYTATDTTGDGYIDTITYNGNTEVREVEINRYIPGSSANRVEANIPGSDPASGKGVFETNKVNLFQTLIRLRDRLLAGQNPVNTPDFSADPATDTLTLAGGFPIQTGAQVQVSSVNGTVPAGLTAGKTYYAVAISPTQIQLAETYADAIAVPPVVVDITDAGSGTLTATETHLGELADCLNHVLNLRADVGGRIKRVDMNNTLLLDNQETNLKALQKREDVDIALAATELSQQQNAYEAALRIIAATLSSSMVDYV
jgi:flagellar hook-associated protein 3